MIVMREIVNAKQTQVHPGNPNQGWLRRLCLSALSLPGRIVALPEWPRFNCRFEANALIEQGFEPASDTLVLGNTLGHWRTAPGLSANRKLRSC